LAFLASSVDLHCGRSVPISYVIFLLKIFRGSYTTHHVDFADSAMTPRLILRHRGQTLRLPSREIAGSRGPCVTDYSDNTLLGHDNLIPVFIFTLRSEKKQREKIIAGRRKVYKILIALIPTD